MRIRTGIFVELLSGTRGGAGERRRGGTLRGDVEQEHAVGGQLLEGSGEERDELREARLVEQVLVRVRADRRRRRASRGRAGARLARRAVVVDVVVGRVVVGRVVGQ